MEIEIKSAAKFELFKNLASGAIFSRRLGASPCIKTDEHNYVHLDSGMEIIVCDTDSLMNESVIVYSKSKLLLEY